MKANFTKMNWLFPVLGIALVAAGIMAGATYLGLERKIDSGQAFAATLERLYQDQQLSVVLKTLHDGDAALAARRLDILLCENILAINSEIASADSRQQACAQDAFVRIAKMRPKNVYTASGPQQLNDDQIEAERILTEACFAIKRSTEALAAAR